LTVRDMARVDDGSELELGASVRTVVAGFGVFAATPVIGRVRRRLLGVSTGGDGQA
jgi:hypothetical protein